MVPSSLPLVPTYDASARAPYCFFIFKNPSAAFSSASSQVALLNFPSPFFPIRTIGCKIRSFEYIISFDNAPLGHTLPNGESLSGSTFTNLPFSIVASIQHLSGHIPHNPFFFSFSILFTSELFFQAINSIFQNISGTCNIESQKSFSFFSKKNLLHLQ